MPKKQKSTDLPKRGVHSSLSRLFTAGEVMMLSHEMNAVERNLNRPDPPMKPRPITVREANRLVRLSFKAPTAEHSS